MGGVSHFLHLHYSLVWALVRRTLKIQKTTTEIQQSLTLPCDHFIAFPQLLFSFRVPTYSLSAYMATFTQ